MKAGLVSQADAQKASGWIKAIAQGQFQDLHPFVAELRKRWPVKLDKRFVNDKEVEDHTALVPTENPARTLSGDKARIYELIARRFLAAFWPDRVEAKTTIITRIEKESFKTTGTVVKQLGWSEVDPPHGRARKDAKGKAGDGEEEEEEDSGLLPPLVKDQGVDTRELAVKSGKTSPPKRMTEADLLGAMQSAGKDLDDEELKGAMKDCGLGTPATRANIIETLLKRGFVERKRNILLPTPKGIELIQVIQAETLKSPQLTGEWEAHMERIRRGDAARDAFMGSIHGFVADLVEQIKRSVPAGPRKAFGPVTGKCPRCGSDLHLRDWEGRHYVKCGATADPQCRLAYDTDDKGEPLERCRLCQGPLRITKGGAKVCALCGKWADDLPAELPPAGDCPKCGKPMRLIPSTARGQYFRRCAPCGVVEPAPVPVKGGK
jgi:DNA topoisomerase-3